jgi:hypothetical protein
MPANASGTAMRTQHEHGVQRRLKRQLILGLLPAVSLSLAACSSSGTVAPHQVTPRVVGGGPGQGPLVISNPTPAPGVKGSEQVALADRVLTVASVRRRKGVNQNFAVIDLDLLIRNRGDQPILNQPTYFQLMGLGGDGFVPRADASGPFYGTIGAQMTRSGTIEFQIPTAAISGLRLLYRPDVATEAVILPLNTG